MSATKLLLEVLSGPLDGAVIELERETEWTCAGVGPLNFPWDDELGKPQARFIVGAEGWSLEAGRAPHGTHRVNKDERLKAGDSIRLGKGDVLNASRSWLLVRAA